MPFDELTKTEPKTVSGKMEPVTISPPRFQRADVKIVGTSIYCQHRFSTKARNKLEEGMRQGERAKKNRKRDPREFTEDYYGALYRTKDGRCGIPAPSFRNAMISACRTAGFAMTRAKLSIFVEADDYDAEDRTPLVYIEGDPIPEDLSPITYVRNASGVVDLRKRPMWEKWSATLHLCWDADQFSAVDVINLLARAGLQVGIGEGRPDSPNSNGLGWGTWQVAEN